MKKIRLQFNGSKEELLKKIPHENIGQIIDEPFIAEIYGSSEKMECFYFFLPQEHLKIARELATKTKPKSSGRSRGVPQNSSVFGPLPRDPVRNNYCRFSRQSHEELELFKISAELNKFMAKKLQEALPSEYKNAMAQVEGVDSSWRYVDTPWLNCNVNMNFAIPYHRDTANFKNTLSNVLIVKKEMTGGELVLPELGVTLSQRDGACIFFSGNKLIHGVKPIKKTSPKGYRASIVFYSLELCKNCLPRPHELARAKQAYSEKNKVKFSTENIEKLRKQLK